MSRKEISDAFIKGLIYDIVNKQEIFISISKGALDQLIEGVEKYAQILFRDCKLVAEHDETRVESGIFIEDLLFVLNFRKSHGMR